MGALRIEAVDTTGNHCADYSEFFAFCKLQVDSLLGAAPDIVDYDLGTQEIQIIPSCTVYSAVIRCPLHLMKVYSGTVC